MPLGAKQSQGVTLLQGLRILIVEDQSLVAMELQDYLEQAGATIVGPVGRLDRAVSKAESEKLDAALLDVDLHGERCWPAADALSDRGVPFVFTTGFSMGIVMPERFAERPTLTKPYREEDVLAALSKLLDLGAPS